MTEERQAQRIKELALGDLKRAVCYLASHLETERRVLHMMVVRAGLFKRMPETAQNFDIHEMMEALERNLQNINSQDYSIDTIKTACESVEGFLFSCLVEAGKTIMNNPNIYNARFHPKGIEHFLCLYENTVPAF